MNLFGLFSKDGVGADSSEISHEDLAAAVKAASCHVVDVREPNEYAGGHVPGAINQPLSRFDPRQLPSDKPVILICKSGGRSASALGKARAAGREDVRHYAGGTMGWQDRGERTET
jgi:rhodanese-related sulfurtransferase